MERILLISPSTLDRKSLIQTLIACMFPTLILGWLFYQNLTANSMNMAVPLGITAAVFLVLLVSGYICTPYKYILTNSDLIIKRHLKDIVIPIQDIKVIRLMTPADKKGMWRSFGAEGLFGSFGYYQTPKYKKLIVYTRRHDNWTLVITDQKKYVIAPDDLQLIDIASQQMGLAVADDQPMEKPVKLWRKWIPVAIIIIVVVITHLAYREPKVEINPNAFRLKGLFGINIPFAGINGTDTISWREIPAISVRTNGISLFKVHRGRFRTTDGDKIRLSINSGVNPVIRVADSNGTVYYINRKNPTETREIFNKIQENIKTNQQ